MAWELRQLIQWPHHEVIKKNCRIALRLLTLEQHALLIVQRSLLKGQHLFLHVARYIPITKGIANAAKFFIAISPTGAVIFISKCRGGHASDKHITSQCGFLDLLINGDMVIADKRFDITEDLAL